MRSPVATVALFLALGLSLGAAEPAVQLLLPSRQLELRSTFEVRFAAEMVAAGQVGKQSDVSPLVFEPPIEGRFVWLSTRSGSFAPAQPLPLGTKFKISLLPSLKDRAGNLLKTKLLETAETPPMRVKGAHHLGSSNLEDASIVPRLLVLFNANVKAAAAARFCRFEDASGNRIAARVEQANDPNKPARSFPSWESDDRTLAAWSAQPDPEAKSEAVTSDFEETRGRQPDEEDGTRRGRTFFLSPRSSRCRVARIGAWFWTREFLPRNGRPRFRSGRRSRLARSSLSQSMNWQRKEIGSRAAGS